MSGNDSIAKEWRAPAFFYGSFIRKEIMAIGGLYPDNIQVVKLSGVCLDTYRNAYEIAGAFRY